MVFNNQAKENFSEINISYIKANDNYPIWEKYDDFGRSYYGVSHFWHVDPNVSSDTDLSWAEWDGNEVNISFENIDLLEQKYIEAIGIIKSWKIQLSKFTGSKFRICLSYDNGDLMDEEDRVYSFTLRFWKKRDNSELITEIDNFDQPVIIDYCE